MQQYIVPALEYALSKANLGHTDKEIVTYINKAWLSKFIELQLKDSDMKRIQRRKDGIYFSKVVSPIMRDVMSMLFGDSLKAIKDIEEIRQCLNKNQVEFLDNVISIIQNDIQQSNFDNFRFDEEGNTVLNKRYLSDCIGMEESNFKHRLRRIQNKVAVLAEEKKQENIRRINKYLEEKYGNKLK